MGNIVDFNEKTNKIKFDKFLINDSYLRTTALNALKLAGYHLNRNSVLQFQHDNNLKETGILSIDDLAVLLTYFNPEIRQEVINYMENNRMNKKKDDKNMISVILTLGGILFFELYGIISCFFDIIHFINK